MLSRSTGAITADALTGFTSVVSGISIRETGGTASVTVTLYDNNAESGQKIWSATVPANGSLGEDIQHPISLNSGACYCGISGSGTPEVVVRGR